jgi:hypothetical protein
MRFTTLATITVLAGFAVAGPMATAYAQPAPQPASGQNEDNRGPGPHRPGPMGGQAIGPMHRPPIDPSVFALMYKPDDRKLTAPDVQKITESMLLWFGNRTWKVTGVAPAADGQIAFAFATADGSVIARFTMDTKNGRVVRTG